MDKVDLKKVLKPLIKECIREVLMESGLQKMISETVQPVKSTVKESVVRQPKQQLVPQQSEAELNKKRMLQEIGKSGYVNNGFNPFANTEALPASMAPRESTGGAVTESRKLPPAMADMDPTDPGIDISGIMNIAANKWKTHMGGKG